MSDNRQEGLPWKNIFTFVGVLFGGTALLTWFVKTTHAPVYSKDQTRYNTTRQNFLTLVKHTKLDHRYLVLSAEMDSNLGAIDSARSQLAKRYLALTNEEVGEEDIAMSTEEYVDKHCKL